MKIMNRTLLLLIIFITTSFTSLYAGPGASAANFLKIGCGSRAVALGETYVSLADDPSALYWNPAGLALLARPSILFSYNKWLEGITHGFVGVNLKKYNWGVLGVGIAYLSLADMDAYDEFDRSIGKASAHDIAAMFGYAKDFMINELKIRYGIEYKYINQKLDDTTANAHGIDIGLLTKVLDDKVQVGFSIQNLLSTKMKFYVAEAMMERVFRLGVSYLGDISKRKYVISAEVDFHEDDVRFGLGSEIEVYDPLVFRLGYRKRDLGNGVSAGLGFEIKDIKIDYAFNNYGEFSDTHMLTISMLLDNFSKLGKKENQNYAWK